MRATHFYIVIASVLSINAQAENLLLNPGFELPAGTNYISLPTGSTAIFGWKTMLNGAEWINATTPYGGAAEGVMMVDLTPFGRAGGGIEQTFATITGTEYELSFSLSTMRNNWRDGTAHIDVTVANIITGYDVTNLSGTLVWTPLVQRFTATGSTTTLQFTNNEHPFSNFAVVDAVSVTTVIPAVSIGTGTPYVAISAIPEPEKYATMLAGLGLLGIAVRNRSPNRLLKYWSTLRSM